MILVAESGSTKTQWCIVGVDKIEFLVNTQGINPLLLSSDEIEVIIRPVSAGIDLSEIQAVYFFGAGCSNLLSKEKIGRAIYNIFECGEIIVDSDLIAACLSLAGDKPAIIGLLGTGSNSCLWNGREIEQKVPSLGYILGDEGGGVSIGKQLVSDFLKNQMPLNLRIKFHEKYDISVDIAIERVYQMPMPNRFLASFAPFAEYYIKEEYCRDLVKKQFESFINRNILQYLRYSDLEILFCGSIAFSHKDILQEVCTAHGLNLGKVVKEPINELALYLQKKVLLS
ncbi:MAG: ATPase [Prolixibacteraceae bacterium]|nr:ATPase [Prolixibacteraceae bacterium]